MRSRGYDLTPFNVYTRHADDDYPIDLKIYGNVPLRAIKSSLLYGELTKIVRI